MNPSDSTSYINMLNPTGLIAKLYPLRYFLWSLFIAFVIVQLTLPGWTVMSWASMGFLTLCFYLIFSATPLLQMSPNFIPAISPFPTTLGRNGISEEAKMAGY